MSAPYCSILPPLFVYSDFGLVIGVTCVDSGSIDKNVPHLELLSEGGEKVLKVRGVFTES